MEHVLLLISSQNAEKLSLFYIITIKMEFISIAKDVLLLVSSVISNQKRVKSFVTRAKKDFIRLT